MTLNRTWFSQFPDPNHKTSESYGIWQPFNILHEKKYAGKFFIAGTFTEVIQTRMIEVSSFHFCVILFSFFIGVSIAHCTMP